ncbi:insulin-like growth factor-binding protein 5a [Tachysurus ichikawai]
MDLEERKALFSACALIALLPACLTYYVPCDPCDPKALSMCPPVPTACQAVKEPGCGCCLTCALREGHECGVYTGTCAAGLRCLPRVGEEKPLHALLHGKGMCMNEKDYKPATDQEPPKGVLGLVSENLLHHSKGPMFSQNHINNKKVLAVQKNRKQLQSKLRTTVHINSSPLSVQKVQPEMGLCRRKLDIIVRRMKDMPRVVALSLYLPNCDKKGFFKRKQCKPSRGQKRGICWCVDKFGATIPGTHYSGGNIQCKDPESNSNNK